MKKSFWFWLYFVIALVLATYFTTRIIMTSLGYGPVARIKTISISADSGNKDLTSIAAAAGVMPGTHAFTASLDQINDRISSVPGVKTSAVRRMPNGNLSIKVNLHQAVALWTDGEKFYPISADGTIVQRPIDDRPDGTVLFHGRVPGDIAEIAKISHNLTQHLDYLEWIEDRRWNIHTKAGITVMLPEQDSIAAIGALIVLNKNHQILSKKIQMLDMRDPGRILVK